MFSLVENDFKIYSLICHRIPERTFNIRGYYFPVCSRCTGIYLGAFSYFIYAYLFYVDYTINLLFIAFLFTIPTVLDGVTQFKGLRKSQNFIRVLTGLIAGIGFAILLKGLKWFIFVNGGF